MKFRLEDAKDWTIDSEIEINTLEELLNLIDNIKNSRWRHNQIIVSQSSSDNYKYDIIIYNDYVE